MYLPSEDEVRSLTKEAVRFFWMTRDKQLSSSEGHNHGARGAVTGGKQMDGFALMVKELLIQNNVPEHFIHMDSALDLPGYFRATKKWDIVVVDPEKEHLLAAIELKSQVGPSFGNNFNNRTEEAMGSALDIWTAYREGIFKTSPQPFVGYLMLLEDCEKSNLPVKVAEPHFEVFPEYKDISYAKRYELFSRKLVLERKYTSACFLLSERGTTGDFSEPAPDLEIHSFLSSLIRHTAR